MEEAWEALEAWRLSTNSVSHRREHSTVVSRKLKTDDGNAFMSRG